MCLRVFLEFYSSFDYFCEAMFDRLFEYVLQGELELERGQDEAWRHGKRKEEERIEDEKIGEEEV